MISVFLKDGNIFNKVEKIIAPVAQIKIKESKRKGCVVLIFDPGVLPTCTKFKDVKYKRFILGDLTPEEVEKYTKIALKKAAWTYVYRKPSSAILDNPGTLEIGETHWPGCEIMHDQIVSTSGLNGEDDVMASRVGIAATISYTVTIGKKLREKGVKFVSENTIKELAA